MPEPTKADVTEWVRTVLRGDVSRISQGHHWVMRDGSASIRISDASLALIVAAMTPANVSHRQDGNCRAWTAGRCEVADCVCARVEMAVDAERERVLKISAGLLSTPAYEQFRRQVESGAQSAFEN